VKQVVAIGLSHKTAGVEVRERFALDEAARRKLAVELHALPGVRESVLLSTCNRTEIYLAGGDDDSPALPVDVIRDRLLEIGNGSGARASDFEVRLDEAAVRHAFAVASGLDSMVLGETQILGQVRGAFQESVAAGCVGPTFSRLFPDAFRLAKRAHAETAISQGQASIGSIAVELASKVFDDLERRSVLLLGAGETGETIAVSLHDRKVARLLIAGRGLERSSRLADKVHGVALSQDDALARLDQVDIVLTAASPERGEFVLDASRLEHALDARRGEPLLIIDVGVPRNVAPGSRDLADLFLYDLDDLEAVAEETRRRRAKEAKKVEAMLEAGVAAFSRWARESEHVGPLLRDLHARIEETRRSELERTLAQIPKEHHAAVERMSRSLVDKLLQAPTIELKKSGAELGDKLSFVRRLFGIEKDDPERDR
jgi:glutamyl-tRNA reductase